jgi:YjjG family noncanonical pyrimidine nucleotidase
MHFDWILFDADHTLFDFDRSSQEALQETLAQYGVAHHPDHWTVYDRINKRCWADFEQGRIGREAMRTMRFSRFFDYLDNPDIDVDAFAMGYLNLLPTRPYFITGAPELLEWLHGKVRMGIITNGLREVQRPRLERTGIDRLFEVIVVSGEINHTKPHHAFFDYAHQHMGRPAHDRVLVVGDSLSADILGGSAFGFRTCWYNPSGQGNNTDVRPDFEIRSLDEISVIAGL